MHEQWGVGDKECWVQKLYAAVLICMWDLISWIQLLQRTLLGVCVIFYAQSVFFQHVAAE